MPKVHIRTLGCPKNEADSEHLRGALREAGYEDAAAAGSADVVIVNTCAFIDSARRESVDAVLEEVSARRAGQRVVVAGCMVERYGPELERELPEVDGFLSLGAYRRAAEVVDESLAGSRPVCFDPGKVPLEQFPRAAPESASAFVKISEGCDRVCTFCAIPGIRGGHRSRPMGAVLTEARWLVKHGVREIVLVAQDMSLYGRDLGGSWLLPDLLRRVGGVAGLDWVRMLYQYPRFVNDSLIAAVAETPNAVPYFDLSLQHASAKLVRRMRRWGSGERFLELIAGIRERIPEAVLRSSFIVGFPGETESDVDELAEFLQQARLDWGGFFTYSREEGTEAASFRRGLVPSRVARQRADALDAVQAEIAERKRAELLGAEVEVLVESRRGTAVIGRSWREAPDVDATILVRGAAGARVGDMIAARVERTDGLDLVARARP
jgi:ribosomal protein S12 methylthiotransferase